MLALLPVDRPLAKAPEGFGMNLVPSRLPPMQEQLLQTAPSTPVPELGIGLAGAVLSGRWPACRGPRALALWLAGC